MDVVQNSNDYPAALQVINAMAEVAQGAIENEDRHRIFKGLSKTFPTEFHRQLKEMCSGLRYRTAKHPIAYDDAVKEVDRAWSADFMSYSTLATVLRVVSDGNSGVQRVKLHLQNGVEVLSTFG